MKVVRVPRAALDANVYVSAALGIWRGDMGSPSVQILLALRAGQFENLTTTTLWYEIAEKLQSPRLGLPIDFTLDFVDALAAMSEFVPIRGLDMGCRDDDDDRLVETAINGRADALVTRDKDILDDQHITAELAKRGCSVMGVEGLRTLLNREHAHPVDAPTK